MQDGFVRVASCSPKLQVGHCSHNAQQIIETLVSLDEQSPAIVLFPELSITGYTCGDLFLQRSLIAKAEAALTQLVVATTNYPAVVVVGIPHRHKSRLYNCAAILHRGKIIGLVPKLHLPTKNEFYEMRWFSSGSEIKATEQTQLCGETISFGWQQLFTTPDRRLTLGVELCEDLWSPIPPSSYMAQAGATVILNLSGSNEVVGKHAYRRGLIEQQSARTHTAYLYASAGAWESTTDLLFGGSCIIAENGVIHHENDRFALASSATIGDIDIELLEQERLRNSSFTHPLATEPTIDYSLTTIEGWVLKEHDDLLRQVNPTPFVPSTEGDWLTRCEEIIEIQSTALARRLAHIGTPTAIIGISGGLDSTLALLVAAKAFDRLGRDRKGIFGVTMPGFGTTDRTYQNALTLIRTLGTTLREIPIATAVRQHFSDIEHDEQLHDITYENCQARERTQILMDLANKEQGIVIGTGDLSELALGWATYNGDHMSMYGVNAAVPKTLVRHLVRWAAESFAGDEARATLLDILDTPVSPELLPADDNGEIAQKTEEIVGPYELHDFYLYHFVRFGFSTSKIRRLTLAAFKGKYDDKTIDRWLNTFVRRFFTQQFKRSCMPDGPKVGSINLSPRGDWRMPSDASFNEWLLPND